MLGSCGRRSIHRPAWLAGLLALLVVDSLACAAGFQLQVDSELGKRLTNLPENSWVQLNVNEFRDAWTPLDQRPDPPDAPSVGGPWSIIEAWSSMAWDSNRGTLIFFGGGHANYPGNDVYRWRASTLGWERASLPSEVFLAVPTVLYLAVDGPQHAPIAAHTYDNSEFLPISDRFITFGGASFNTGHYFDKADGTRTGPYMWDPSRAGSNSVGGTAGSQVKPGVYASVTAGQMWQNRDNLEPASPSDGKPGYMGTYWINGTTAYATEGGKDVLYIQTSAELYKYTVVDLNDPTRDTYQLVGRYIQFPITGQGAGAVDVSRQIYLRTAGTAFTYWRIDAPSASNENVIFTPADPSGSFPFADLDMFGLDFDPLRKSFVLWDGTRSVWRLTPPANLGAGQWQLQKLTPGSTAAPAVVTPHTGILGKWKYAAALDVFLGAFDKDRGQIWAYKPTNWQPSVTSPLPFVVLPADGSSYATGAAIPIRIDSVDKSVARVELYANSALIGVGNSVPYDFTWSGATAGNYAVSAIAVGADSVRRQSPAISIAVTGNGNLPPTVSLTAPAGGATIAQGSDVLLTATANDADGTIARVEFYAGVDKLGEDATSPYSFTWPAPAAGVYGLTAHAIDNSGATAVSGTVQVSIVAANVPPAVTLTSPTAGSSFRTTDSIALAASANDGDGTVQKVEFLSDGALLGIDSTSPYMYDWVNPPAGTHTLSARATDDRGATTTSTSVQVTVSKAAGGGSGGGGGGASTPATLLLIVAAALARASRRRADAARAPGRGVQSL